MLFRGTCRKMRTVAVAMTLVFVLVILLQNASRLYIREHEHPRENEQRPIEPLASATSAYKGNENQVACLYPKLDPWDKGLTNLLKDSPPLKCAASDKNWVELVDRKIVIMPFTKKFGTVSCRVTPFTRFSDYDTHEIKEIPMANNTVLPSDFFRVRCSAGNGSYTYNNIHAGVRIEKSLLNCRLLTKDGLGLNVLMIGLDSVSRMTFMRKLPKTIKYLTDVLGTVILKGYNIVGDGTPQALIPILTGRTELELPRALKRLKNGVSCDVFPMVWKNFSEKGYVTAFGEDEVGYGTFTFRMNGFTKQPTDHYMRTFYNKLKKEEHKPYCIGDRPRFRVALDNIREFMETYRSCPRFGFMFHNEISHDGSELLHTADDDLVETLKKMRNSGLLDNTMLIVMSDHGARFSKLRQTVQGKQEERNPFFSFTFPQWFATKHQKAFSNVIKNSERLVTPFDIYPTLMDMLDFRGTEMGDKTTRGISIFQEIPLSRTCKDAGVEPHWCNCLHWKAINKTDDRVREASLKLVEHINELTNPRRSICLKLSLKNIIQSSNYELSKEMLAFQKTVDLDGFKPDLSGKMRSEKEVFQIVISTTPNNGLYESSVERNVASNVYTVRTSDISRTNSYGEDAHCVVNTEEQLRKFCLCRDRFRQAS